MARQSFVLRTNRAHGGSYLQYYPSGGSASVFGPASATYLRGDDVQIATRESILSDLTFLEGYASDYREVTLDWSVTLDSDYSTSEYPVPYEVLIVYSEVGPPTTIPEGEILIRTRDVSSLVHKLHESADGLWAYYTLFIHYLSSNANDDFYEPISYLSVLIPNDYNSTDAMYSRVPSWYQGLDERNGSNLYTFLDIFGRDVDYMRTLLDYMMAMKDPQVADIYELNNTARDLGIDLSFEDLGAERLRKLLDNIGGIRRSKGTLSAIKKEISAITGSSVDVYLDENNKIVIDVYPQRCNLVRDPRIKNGVLTGLDGGSALNLSIEKFDVGGPGDTPGGPGDIYDGGTPGQSGFVTVGGNNARWVSYPSPDDGRYEVLETLDSDIPVRAGDTFYFSTQTDNVDQRGQESIVSVALYTEGGRTEGTLIKETVEFTDINGVKYWRIDVPNNFNIVSGVAEYALASLAITYNPVLSPTQEFFGNFTEILFERNFVGDYFDGDTRIGGWLVNGMNSISDYRWRDPLNDPLIENYEKFSVYNANYYKTKTILNELLPSILPVSLLTYEGSVFSNRPITTPGYTVNWDVIPGQHIYP